MRFHRLLPLLLLVGCAQLQGGFFEPESSFKPTGRQVGNAIEIGRDEWARYAVAYLPENVRRNGDVVTIQTEWITIGDGSTSTRKLFELDCRGKRYRITHIAFGNEPLRPNSLSGQWSPITRYTSTSDKSVWRHFCS